MELQINTRIIRMARINKGFSQAALARHVGISLVTLNLLETNKTKSPHPSTMKKICDALDINISDVYSNT